MNQTSKESFTAVEPEERPRTVAYLHTMINASIFGWPEGECENAHKLLDELLAKQQKVVEAAVRFRMAWLQDGGNVGNRPAGCFTISAADELHKVLTEAGMGYGDPETNRILGFPFPRKDATGKKDEH